MHEYPFLLRDGRDLGKVVGFQHIVHVNLRIDLNPVFGEDRVRRPLHSNARTRRNSWGARSRLRQNDSGGNVAFLGTFGDPRAVMLGPPDASRM